MNTCTCMSDGEADKEAHVARVYMFASLLALMILTPGATMSGFIRPSNAGPREENSARLVGP